MVPGLWRFSFIVTGGKFFDFSSGMAILFSSQSSGIKRKMGQKESLGMLFF